MSKVAVFASGSGSNAEKIFDYFNKSDEIKIVLLVCNRKEAGVYERAQRFGIEQAYVPKSKTESLPGLMKSKSIDFIVLAGYLLKVPDELIALYSGKIINIHPSLLPKYGGQDMYGIRVHEAVITAKEKESGITIHLVNEAYDEGKILFQDKLAVLPTYDADRLAKEVLKLEHQHYAPQIEKWIHSNTKKL